jgi:hypothetical protein
MGKWISDSRAESGVAVKYRRSSKLCCSCVRQVQQIGHGGRVLVRFQVKIGIPLFDLE